MSESHSLVEMSEMKIQLSPRRWWLMGSVGIQTVLACVSFLYFGVINDLFANYFEISYTMIDWFSLITRPAAWLACVGFAGLAILNKSGFRKIALTTASLSVVASICQLLAYAFQFLYWFMYVGNFLVGISVGYFVVIPVSFSVLWFPDNEIGTALSMRQAFARLGFLLAFLVPSHFLTPLQCDPTNEKEFNITEKYDIAQCKQSWMDEEKRKLMVYVGVILIIGVLTLIFLIMFAVDQPPMPPTRAQAQLRQNIKEINESNVWNKLKDAFTETKSLFTDITFLILMALLATANFFNYSQALYLSQILRPIFQSYFSSSKADVVSSYLIVGFEIAGIIGAFATGLLMDRFKNYVLLLRVYFAWCVIWWIVLIVGFYFHNVPVVFAANILSGVGCGSLFVPIYELSTQHTHPRKPEFIVPCLTCGYSIIFIVLIELTRPILDNLGELNTLIYQAVVLCIALLLTVLLKPKYRRLEAENEANGNNSAEAEPLLLRNNDSDCFEH